MTLYSVLHAAKRIVGSVWERERFGLSLLHRWHEDRVSCSDIHGRPSTQSLGVIVGSEDDSCYSASATALEHQWIVERETETERERVELYMPVPRNTASSPDPIWMCVFFRECIYSSNHLPDLDAQQTWGCRKGTSEEGDEFTWTLDNYKSWFPIFSTPLFLYRSQTVSPIWSDDAWGMKYSVYAVHSWGKVRKSHSRTDQHLSFISWVVHPV